MHCPECQTPGAQWYRSVGNNFSFYRCNLCELIYRDPPLWQVINYSKYGKKQKVDWAISGPGAEARAEHLHQKLHSALSQSDVSLKDKRLLEIGCGPGILLNRLAEEYPSGQFYGLDPTANHVPVKGYIRLSGALEDTPLEPNSIDVVVMFGNFMLHKSPAQSLALISKALRPGGLLVFDYKNPQTLSRAIVRSVRPLGLLFRHPFAKLERQAFHGINFAPLDVGKLLFESGMKVESTSTAHSLGIETGRGVLAKGVRLIDMINGQKAWVEVVARRT